MIWDVFNNKGKKVRELTLSDDVFNVEMNEGVLHSVVKAYNANRRQGTVATKTRSLVSGGGKKPFRQKGTGNARQGSSRSPLMPGGATVHGPQPRDHREFTNKKVKNLALRIALSDKARHSKLIVVDDFAIASYKTKAILELLSALETQKALLSDMTTQDFLYRSVRNIHGVSSVPAQEVNAENVLRYETLVISEKALKALEQRLMRKVV
jgi:large subunit ribosomal protein L4